MIWRYRKQWVMWILINSISLIMFIQLKQWSMVVMYAAWLINAIYGWYNWSKLAIKNTANAATCNESIFHINTLTNKL